MYADWLLKCSEMVPVLDGPACTRVLIEAGATSGLCTGFQRDAAGWTAWNLLRRRVYATPPKHGGRESRKGGGE